MSVWSSRIRVRMQAVLVRALVVVVALIGLSEESIAGQLKLAWNAVAGATGYRLYYGTSSGNYASSVDAQNQTTATVSNLTDGARYFFAVKAYNNMTMSGLSNEVNGVVPASAGTSNPFTPDTTPPVRPAGLRVVQ
jgi:Fibronectin type III domain